MATNYPGAIDSFTNPGSGDALTSPSHSAQHANANDAIEAVQAELGTDPAGASATVKARFEVIEANDWVTSARIAADAVGSSEIAANAVGASELADNAVDTAAVADSAITTAKVAAGAVTYDKLARQPGNLLTEAAAATSDTADFTVYQLAQWSASISSGVLRVTKSADTAAGFRAGTGGAAVSSSSTAMGTGTIPVSPGDTYTFTGEVQASAGIGGTALTPTIYWWTSAGNVAASTASSTGATVAWSTSWVRGEVTAVAPANAAFASVALRASSGITGLTSQYVELRRWSFHRGSGGTFVLPGVPVPGQGAIKANGAVELPGGDYSPEGVVTANPGSTFLQTSGAATVTGMLSWRKATGTGNTGWVAEGALADTGWRDVSADLLNGWTLGSYSFVRIRRVGSTVHFHANGLNGSAKTDDKFYTTLTGWRIPRQGNYQKFGFAGAKQDGTVLGFWYDTNNGAPTFTFAGVSNTTAQCLLISWVTDDSWPSSLPGS